MAWSVFDGTDSGSREDLFRYARLQAPHSKAVLAGLDWANDSDWYIGHALDNGFEPSAADVVKLAEDWGYSDVLRLVRGCAGSLSQKQLLGLLDYVDDRDVKQVVRHAVASGTRLDDAGMCTVFDYVEDKELADALVALRVADKGPYTASELCPAYDRPAITEHCSRGAVEALLRGMRGRLSYEQAMDFMTYHVCDDYTDDTLEALLSVTDCTREEADDLLFGNGYSRRPDPLLAQAASRPEPVRLGFFEALGMAFIGKAAWDALHGGSGAETGGEPPFQDFNHAWGSDNDHNWQADGDLRWDDYSGM